MRKRSVVLTAATAVLLLTSLAWRAEAATSNASTIPNAARNFSPVHPAACQGFGRWCPPGFVRACNPYRCWCRPCM